MAILGGRFQWQKLTRGIGTSKQIADLSPEPTNAVQIASTQGSNFPSSVDLFIPWKPRTPETSFNPRGILKKPNG